MSSSESGSCTGYISDGCGAVSSEDSGDFGPTAGSKAQERRSQTERSEKCSKAAGSPAVQHPIQPNRQRIRNQSRRRLTCREIGYHPSGTMNFSCALPKDTCPFAQAKQIRVLYKPDTKYNTRLFGKSNIRAPQNSP